MLNLTFKDSFDGMMSSAMPEIHNQSSGLLAQESGTAALNEQLLSNVLENIRLKGAVFFAWQPRWPYATGVPDGQYFRELILPSSEQVISYHIVLQGPCWATVQGEAPIRLESGDILLLPHGHAYAIADQPYSPCAEDIEPARQFFTMMAAGELPLIIQDGGTGPEANSLVCGFLGCDRHPCNPVMNDLPRSVVLPRSALERPVNDLIDIVLRECQEPHGGNHYMMVRLGELLFIEVLRLYLRQQGSEQNAWLKGLKDPLIANALALLHGRLKESWTLEKLARELGSSRSTLAEHFHQVLGVPPMQYLAEWRMQVAARLLREGQGKVQSIAREVGYDSEAAFSRAFKRIVGVSPSTWRERA